MKTKLALLLLLAITTFLEAQQKTSKPDLSTVFDTAQWQVVNREINFNNEVNFDARKGDGLLFLKDFEFTNGTIEADIRGENKPGQSFVGIAFHGENDSTYDAVYFRPFNFQNKERSNHSVQYICMPKYNWSKLRNDFPGKYENTLNVVPDPNDWFHVKIVAINQRVKVYIEYSDIPALEVDMLSKAGKGWVGFWVGYGSKGSFKKLVIKPVDNN